MRRSAGLQRRLTDASIEAYILALETINRLSVTYRIETFAYLICNAWELLLKAKIIQDTGNPKAIFYKTKRGAPKRSWSLRDCLVRVFVQDNNPIRRNLELIEELRDDGTHLVIRQVPHEVMSLFQACVVNYHNRLSDWFDLSLSKRLNVGMLAIVYDLGPDQFDLSSSVLRRKLGRDTALYLAQFQAKLRKAFIELGQPTEFSIGIGYKLTLTKKPGEGDIVLTKGEVGKAIGIVEVPKDPSSTHPYRRTELVEEVNAALQGRTRITTHDIDCIVKLYQIRRRPEYYYQGSVKGSPVQYSHSFVEWIAGQFRNDSNFFAKAREKQKASKKTGNLEIVRSAPRRAPPMADVEGQQVAIEVGASRQVPAGADLRWET